MIGPVGMNNAFLRRIDTTANERCSLGAQAGSKKLRIVTSRDGGAIMVRSTHLSAIKSHSGFFPPQRHYSLSAVAYDAKTHTRLPLSLLTTDGFAQQPLISQAPEVPPGRVDDPAAQVEKAPPNNQKIVWVVMWLPGVRRR